MGAHQSKEELVYQQVNYGNVEGIKSLRREGAGLEWVDKEGKTPLILACMRPDLLNVAKVLIELGANVNAYRPGGHAGTPMHHAAKRGLDQTVNLLLSSGANPLVMNDDCQTPLDLARTKGHGNVVRAIESRICLFCGWLRELFGPSILEAFAPQWVQRKIWAVVLPCDSRNPTTPRRFELAIYPDLQVAQPRVTIALWKVHFDEPKFNQADPTLVIVDKTSSIYDHLPHRRHTRFRSSCGRQSHRLNHSKKPECQSSTTSSSEASFIVDASSISKATKSGKKALSYLHHFETRYKFLSALEGDKQQLLRFYNACRGLSQQNSYVLVAPPDARPTPNPSHIHSNVSAAAAPAPAPTHSPVPEDVQLAMAINASIQSALAEGVPVPNPQPVNLSTKTNGWAPSENTTATYNGWGQSSGAPPPSKVATTSDPFNGWSGVRPSSSSPQLHNSQLETPSVLPSAHEAPPTVTVPSAPPTVPVPSAPPLAEETFYPGPVQYPTIDSSPVDLSMPAVGSKPEPSDPKEDSSSGASSSCVICLDAPVEGACIPCGHMAGCMSCLNEIKGKKWGCPVCRANIDQVVRLYAV